MDLTIVILIYTIILILLSFWIYCKITCGICEYSGHLIGKTVIVTGANSGIGYETAKDLAQRGAKVILACRNLARGASARDKIIASSNNNNVHLLHLDLASLASVRRFVDSIVQNEERLDILINNAGQYYTENKKTEDGLVLGMQVNYFSSFLLTSLLLPLLKASAPSRIINVSSIVHFYGRTDLNNLNTEYSGIFNSHIVYATAKLCLLQMTMELNRRYKFTGLTAYALHPGVVNTEMVQHLNSWFIRNVLKIFQTFHKTPWEGAQTTIYLAVSPEINKSGFFFKDCREARSSRAVQDLESATKLWELSERYVNLK